MPRCNEDLSFPLPGAKEGGQGWTDASTARSSAGMSDTTDGMPVDRGECTAQDFADQTQPGEGMLERGFRKFSDEKIVEPDYIVWPLSEETGQNDDVGGFVKRGIE